MDTIEQRTSAADPQCHVRPFCTYAQHLATIQFQKSLSKTKKTSQLFVFLLATSSGVTYGGHRKQLTKLPNMSIRYQYLGVTGQSTYGTPFRFMR